MNGTDVLVVVNVGTPTLIDYRIVGCQRDVAFEESRQEIDLGSRDLTVWRGCAGRMSAHVSLDALYVPTDAAYQALRHAMRAKERILIGQQRDGAIQGTATAIILGLSEGYPDQEAATVAVRLRIDGGWTAAAWLVTDEGDFLVDHEGNILVAI